MTAARFSIGLPFLDPGPWLELAVRSVFAQTEQDWELVLVDDGSSDGSIERLRRIDDPRVRLVADGRRRGLPARLNEIARLAESPLLVRMDADDVMRAHRLEELAGLALGGDEICAAHAVLIDAAGEPYAELRSSGEQAFRNDYVIHPTVAGPTDWFRRNPYSEDYLRAEDRELWCRTWKPGAVRLVEQPLLFYRRPRRLELAKHRKTLPSLLRLACRYGPDHIGRRATLAHLTFLAGKQVAYEILHLLHLDEALTARRRAQLAAPVADGYREELRRISATRVPGWTSGGTW